MGNKFGLTKINCHVKRHMHWHKTNKQINHLHTHTHTPYAWFVTGKPFLLCLLSDRCYRLFIVWSNSLYAKDQCSRQWLWAKKSIIPHFGKCNTFLCQCSTLPIHFCLHNKRQVIYWKAKKNPEKWIKSKFEWIKFPNEMNWHGAASTESTID